MRDWSVGPRRRRAKSTSTGQVHRSVDGASWLVRAVGCCRAWRSLQAASGDLIGSAAPRLDRGALRRPGVAARSGSSASKTDRPFDHRRTSRQHVSQRCPLNRVRATSCTHAGQRLPGRWQTDDGRKSGPGSGSPRRRNTLPGGCTVGTSVSEIAARASVRPTICRYSLTPHASHARMNASPS